MACEFGAGDSTFAWLSGGSPVRDTADRGLAYERLDHRLAADVKVFGGPVEFFKHSAGVGKES